MNKKISYFRVIGDVHAKYDKYAHLAAGALYSLQLGDMGFDYSYINRIVDSSHAKAIGGNHDNYNKRICTTCADVDYPTPGECSVCQGRGHIYYDQTNHFLGDYGVWDIPSFGLVFFVRGAWSIDQAYRVPGISWWEDEELSVQQGYKAFELYEKVKPELVVTHTCPDFIVPEIPFERIFGPTIHHPKTEALLEMLYRAHQPKLWIFGHFHRDWDWTYKNPDTGKETRFICLNELSYADFASEKLEPVVRTCKGSLIK